MTDADIERQLKYDALRAAAYDNPMGHASMALNMTDTIDDAIAEYDRIIAELTKDDVPF